MPTLQERAAAGEHLNADEVGKLLDIIAPKPETSPPTPVPAVEVPPQPTYDTNRQKKLVPILLPQILVPKDRRPLDEIKIAELVESIRRNGLLEPIGVRRLVPPLHHRHFWQLVIGGHRCEALRRLGWERVSCTEIESANPLHWELTEIDENLARNNVSPAEEAGPILASLS